MPGRSKINISNRINGDDKITDRPWTSESMGSDMIGDGFNQESIVDQRLVDDSGGRQEVVRISADIG